MAGRLEASRTSIPTDGSMSTTLAASATLWSATASPPMPDSAPHSTPPFRLSCPSLLLCCSQPAHAPYRPRSYDERGAYLGEKAQTRKVGVYEIRLSHL